MVNKKIKVAILCQSDVFVIPRNIQLLNEISELSIVGVINIKHKSSLENKKMLFLKGFGIFQTTKLFLLKLLYNFFDLIDRLLFYKLKLYRSLKSASHNSNSKYMVINDPNNESFKKWLRSEEIDLIISFSAPCIFYEDLLEIPVFGCINLHCSLLPKYPGLLPSFWTIFHKEKEIGATVHQMDCKIDNGKILGQIKLKMPKNPTVYSVINLTKNAGGKLMVQVVKHIIRGSLIKIDNSVSDDDYFSWPTLLEIKKFRKEGGRLI